MCPAEYFYLMMSLALLAISLVGLFLCRTHRKIILISGLLSMPCSLSTFLFVPEYWDPVRLFDLQLGIEDIFFSFSTGIIAVMISLRFNQNLTANAEWAKMAGRILRVMGAGIFLIFLMQQTEIMVMLQALIGIAIIGVILVWNRWRLLSTALKTGAVFSCFYTGVLAITFIAFPAFHDQWTHSNLSGISLVGIPLEETLWAFSFGSCWIITIGFFIDLRE